VTSIESAAIVRDPEPAAQKRVPRNDSGGRGRDRDRRRATRYPTRNTPVLIGWLDGGKGRKITTSLVNISAHGAMVEAESQPLPPTGTLVMFRLVTDVTDWVMRAEVVDVNTPQAPGRFSFRKKPERLASQLRLVFKEACPYEFFKASIAGFVVEGMGTGLQARS
jgi:hypothetical protein